MTQVGPVITHTSNLRAVFLPLFTGGEAPLGASPLYAESSHTDSCWAGALDSDCAHEGFGIIRLGRQTFSARSKIVNILGFLDQEAKSRVLII